MFGLIPFRMTRGNNTTISSLTDLLIISLMMILQQLLMVAMI